MFMEISKFIRDALKDGSLDKVSKGIEQLVMMMINAIGMIEDRELEFEKRFETLEEDVDIIKSFLLSTPVPVQKRPQPPSPAPSSAKIQPAPISTSASSLPTQSHPPVSSTQPSRAPLVSSSGPTEEDIIAFRKKILKPTPKHEKPKAQPLSIRAALMQEMKDFFGSAMNKVEKEKKNAD